MMDCTCETPDVQLYQLGLWRSIGTDVTDGRFGEARVDQCVICGRLWLHYAVEYEGFSRSGRWARGQVSELLAATINAAAVPGVLEMLPNYVFGGSYFEGRSGIAAGPMPWGL